MTSQHDMQGLDPKALEAMATAIAYELGHTFADLPEASREGDATKGDYLDAAKAALASLPQQTAEPVAWVTPETLDDLLKQRPWTAGAIGEFSQREKDNYTVPLYTHPASPPVGRAVKGLLGSDDDPESLSNALQIGAMGTPFRDYQGTLYMNPRYKADEYRDAEFRDYGLARAVRIILNNADDILSALASERSGREAVLAEVEQAVSALEMPPSKGDSWEYRRSFNNGILQAIAAIRNLAGTNTNG